MIDIRERTGEFFAYYLTLIGGVYGVFLSADAFLLFVFSWTKGTLPRYRYDQLMRLGWKVFLPVSLGWVVLTAAVLQFGGLVSGK
mgnify:CR=1 FL=1